MLPPFCPPSDPIGNLKGAPTVRPFLSENPDKKRRGRPPDDPQNNCVAFLKLITFVQQCNIHHSPFVHFAKNRELAKITLYNFSEVKYNEPIKENRKEMKK